MSVEIYIDLVIHETSPGEPNEGAILCEVGDRQVWIPKAAISEDSDVYKKGDTGIVMIPEKLALDKELI